MSNVIAFEMALDKEPDRIRLWEYKPLSLKGIKKGNIPKFIVVEKGVGVVHLTVTRNESGIHFTKSEQGEFSDNDSQRAAGKIMEGMFAMANKHNLINQVQ